MNACQEILTKKWIVHVFCVKESLQKRFCYKHRLSWIEDCTVKRALEAPPKCVLQPNTVIHAIVHSSASDSG